MPSENEAKRTALRWLSVGRSSWAVGMCFCPFPWICPAFLHFLRAELFEFRFIQIGRGPELQEALPSLPIFH